jgi:hypothetical protein
MAEALVALAVYITLLFEIDGIFTRRQTIDDSRPWQNPCTTVVITAVDEADYGQPYQNIPEVPLGFLRVFEH